MCKQKRESNKQNWIYAKHVTSLSHSLSTFCFVPRRDDIVDCSMLCNRGSNNKNNDDVNAKYSKINRTRGMSYVDFFWYSCLV